MKAFKAAVTAGAITLAAGAAQAAPVTVEQIGTLTSIGQDFTFTFSGISNFIGGAVVTITTLGGATPGLDLSGAFTGEDENFEVLFDSISQGFFSCGGPSNNGSTAIPGAVDNSFNFNDCAFSLPLAIDAATFASLAGDGALDVGVFFGDQVSFVEHLDQFKVSLSYETTVAPVPLPASALMLGAGLLGLGAVARRRKTRA